MLNSEWNWDNLCDPRPRILSLELVTEGRGTGRHNVYLFCQLYDFTGYGKSKLEFAPNKIAAQYNCF